MSVRGNRELGSVVTFFIIGIVLVVATVGTITIVVKRGEQVRTDQANTASKQLADQNKQNAANAAKAAAASAAASTVATTPAVPQSNAAVLPTTGTEPDVVRIVAIGLLVGTSTSFILSRRGLKRSL